MSTNAHRLGTLRAPGSRRVTGYRCMAPGCTWRPAPPLKGPGRSPEDQHAEHLYALVPKRGRR